MKKKFIRKHKAKNFTHKVKVKNKNKFILKLAKSTVILSNITLNDLIVGQTI